MDYYSLLYHVSIIVFLDAIPKEFDDDLPSNALY